MKISGSDTLGRTPGQIISQNVFTLFNLLNVIIAVMLLLVHAYSNMAFLAIIILNTLIGIVQELKARKQVEKLRILNRPNATVLRNGEAVEIPADLLNVDDVTVLESGRQVCADAEILRLSHQASACAGNSSSVSLQPLRRHPPERRTDTPLLLQAGNVRQNHFRRPSCHRLPDGAKSRSPLLGPCH